MPSNWSMPERLEKSSAFQWPFFYGQQAPFNNVCMKKYSKFPFLHLEYSKFPFLHLDPEKHIYV